MFSPNDTLKIEIEAEIEDVLRALSVLGRSNGSSSGKVYAAIKQAVDPNGLYQPPSCISNEVGVICYHRIEDEVVHHFFTTHQKKVELKLAEKALMDAQIHVDKLRREIGE